MKVVVRDAYYSFWASKERRARMQTSEVEGYKQAFERSGDTVTDIIPIVNQYGNIKFWVFKIKEK